MTDDFGQLSLFKRCSYCTSWKPQQTGYFSPRRRDPVTRRVIRWDSYCLICRRAASKAYRDNLPLERREEIARRWWARVKANPQRLEHRRAQNRDAMRMLRARDPERARNATRRYYERVRADPVKWAQYLESQRMANRLRREARDGVHADDIRSSSVATMPPEGREPRLPAEPLAAVLNDMVESAAALFEGQDYAAQQVICDRAGIAPRQLWAWTTGEVRLAQFETVDRVLTRLEIPWTDVYPMEEAS